MSAPLALNDTIRITYFGRLFNQVIESVLHARVVTLPSGGSTAEIQLEDLANKLSAPTFPFLSAYMSAAGNNFTMDYVRAQKVAPLRTIYLEAAISTGGGFGGVCTASNVACSIEKQSTTVGKKGIGRLQFGPVPYTQILNGQLDPAYLAVQMNGLATTMFGSFAGGPLYAGVYGWCLPANSVTPGGYDVFNAFAYPTLRTMHRRTVGLGI